MTDHLTSRAQRLVEEFEYSESVREGIANVLLHLAATWANYSDGEAGDRAAARQFLQEAGFVDEHGQLTAPYRLETPDD